MVTKTTSYVAYHKMDIVRLATFLTTANTLYSDFIIYEDHFDICIGLGVRTKIDVEKDQFVIPSSKRKCIAYHHLSKDLHRLLGEIDDGKE